MSKPTGRFDYKLKDQVESLKEENVRLEKLLYQYKEDSSKYEQLSS